MFKKFLFAIAVSTIALNAVAEDKKPAPQPQAEKIAGKHFEDKKMSDEEWAKLSKEEKLKILETRRAERMKKAEEKWSKMSADEKIAQYEKRREMGKKMRERREEREDLLKKCKEMQQQAPAKGEDAKKQQPKPMPAKS